MAVLGEGLQLAVSPAVLETTLHRLADRERAFPVASAPSRTRSQQSLLAGPQGAAAHGCLLTTPASELEGSQQGVRENHTG